MFMVANQTDDDIPAVEAAAAPFKSLSQREFLQGLISALPQEWFDQLFDADADLMRQELACLTCYPSATLRAMFLQQWCLYWNTAP